MSRLELDTFSEFYIPSSQNLQETELALNLYGSRARLLEEDAPLTITAVLSSKGAFEVSTSSKELFEMI